MKLLSLQTLPIEIVYRILDHFTEEQLFLAINNVCQRLNAIIKSYLRYQVNKLKFEKNLFFNDRRLFSRQLRI